MNKFNAAPAGLAAACARCYYKGTAQGLHRREISQRMRQQAAASALIPIRLLSMLSNFLVCLNAVLPLFILIYIGTLVQRFRLLKPDEVRRVNRLVFMVLFGPMMFENVYTADIPGSIDGGAVIFAVVFVLAEIGLATPFVLKTEADNKKRGAMIQAMYRSNVVVMGLPLAINIFGKEGAAGTAVMMAIVGIVYNIAAVIILETFRGGKASPAGLLKKMAKNPIILGTTSGLIFNLAHIPLAQPLNTVIAQMGAAATPMALIILGASFSFAGLRRIGRDLAAVVSARLVVLPALGLSLAALAGFRGVTFVALVGVIATPCAVASYTMAEAMDSDGALAGAAVVVSSFFSLITLFCWLFLFRSLGVF